MRRRGTRKRRRPTRKRRRWTYKRRARARRRTQRGGVSEPKILVLIIYSPQNPRWVYQHDKYMRLIERNRHSNVHFKFIQCRKGTKKDLADANHMYLECKEESVVPGILSATVMAMNKYKGEYDYVLRTNVSTYIDIERLLAMIRDFDTKTDKDTPLYTGAIRYSWGISGTSILMNRTAANILLKELPYESVLKETEPEDVAIGKVLREHMQYDHKYDIYRWSFNQTPSENMRLFSERRTPFIRVKPDPELGNPSEMDGIYDAIYAGTR